MSEMNGQHSHAELEQEAHEVREKNGRVLGWISGLGLLVVPWFVAGFVATAATMVGSSSWSAERVFPWAFPAAVAIGLLWVAFGSLRISQFARGAIPGTAISLGVIGAIYLVSLFMR